MLQAGRSGRLPAPPLWGYPRGMGIPGLSSREQPCAYTQICSRKVRLVGAFHCSTRPPIRPSSIFLLAYFCAVVRTAQKSCAEPQSRSVIPGHGSAQLPNASLSHWVSRFPQGTVTWSRSSAAIRPSCEPGIATAKRSPFSRGLPGHSECSLWRLPQIGIFPESSRGPT